MENIKKQKEKTAYLTTLGILSALVILLQVVLGAVKLGPVSVTFTLVPITLGAMILGETAGIVLGAVFGIVVIVMGLNGADGFTFLLLSEQPVFTVLICLVKGVAAGFVPGLVYKLVKGDGRPESTRGIVASFAAAVTAPIANTGLFILGGLLLVGDTLTANFGTFGWSGDSLLLFLIIGCAGFNFLAELAINVVVAPVLNRVYSAVHKRAK